MPTFFGAIDLSKNELRNAAVQNLGSAPSSPTKGQVYFNTGDNTLYWYDGTQWVAAKGSGSVSYATTATTLAIGGAAAAGASTNVAREDHSHGLPGFGTITADTTFGTAKSDGVATTLARSDHSHGSPTHDAAAHSAIPLSALAVPTTSVAFNSKAITGLLDPTNAQDAATKNYVDSTAQGLDVKGSVKVASVGNLTLSGTQTIDGVAVIVNDRVLAKDQSTPATNGIYLVAAGAWTRATDLDSWVEVSGAFTWVEQGTVNADTGWVCVADQGGTLGTTGMGWTQFAGAAMLGAGNGLTKTGNTLDLVAGDTTLTVTADAVVVNTAVIATAASVTAAVTGLAKKYSAALTGTAAYATGEVVTHNLNTRDVQVTVLNGSTPWQAVEVDWEATGLNTVTLRFNPNLGAGYRVVVVG